MITQTQIQHICHNAPEHIADMLTDHCPTFGINTPLRLCHFIAQVAHESGEFRIKEENLNYSTAKRIIAVWPSRFTKEADALPYVRNARALANRVYMRQELGNTYPDAGWLNRGGGFIQITGHYAYEKFGEYIGESAEEVRIHVRTRDDYAMRSACWLFSVEKKLLDDADADALERITRRINGGLVGLENRRKYLRRAKETLI